MLSHEYGHFHRNCDKDDKIKIIDISRGGYMITNYSHVNIVGIIAVNIRNITVKKTHPALLITSEASLPMS